MKFKKIIAYTAVISTIAANSLNAFADEVVPAEIELSSESENAEIEENAENTEVYEEVSEEDISDFQDEASQNTETIAEAATNEETPDISSGNISSHSHDEDVSDEIIMFANGSGTKEDPYKISTAQELNDIRNDLSAHYILTSDIDLSSYENWQPIGTFVPLGESGEEAETPNPSYAFTGSFDGASHTVSGLSISKEGEFCVGLFGCISGSEIKDVTIKDAKVTGSLMAGSLVGYLYDSSMTNINLTGDNVVKAVQSSMGADMIGGIAGAGMDSKITSCSAEANIELCDGASNAGIAVGGFEVCSIKDCDAKGTIDAGNGCTGLGGVAGCNFGGDDVSGCTSDVSINAGENAYLVGGIAGYAGGFDGVITEVADCSANADITLGDGAERIGGVIGGGFFNEGYVSYFPNPSSFSVKNSSSEGSITAPNGKNIGLIAGYTLLSDVEGSCTSKMTINGIDGDIIGDSENYAVLNELQGEYQQYFTGGVFSSRYDKFWHDYTALVVGEDNADATVAMLKSSIGGKLYGEEAIEAYSAHPENMQFHCDFINGVSYITIDGSNISGTDENGNELFSHTYHYYDTVVSEDMPSFVFDIFETNEDAGDFRYFAFAPDTPSTTYHIEFRYGDTLEGLTSCLSGKYAYWLAAGALRSAFEDKDNTIEKVTALFCTENLAETASERTPSSLSQLSDIVGKWNCDMSAFAAVPEYKNADMYIELKEDGSGTTYVDMAGSGTYYPASEFSFFAYDNDNSANKKSGLYAAYTDDEGMETSKYEVSEDANKIYLTFYSLDGDKILTYYRVKEVEEEVKERSESEEAGSSKKSSRSSGGSGKSSSRASGKASESKDEAKSGIPAEKETVSANEKINNASENSAKIVISIGSSKASVFGKNVTLSEAPVIENSRTMVPVRFIAENLGFDVNWDQTEGKAVISADENEVTVTVGSETAQINGEEKLLDSPAFNRNGSMYVPLRFVAEALNANVSWNAADKSITVTKR